MYIDMENIMIKVGLIIFEMLRIFFVMIIEFNGERLVLYLLKNNCILN